MRRKYNIRGITSIGWFVSIAFIILFTASSGSSMGSNRGNLNKKMNHLNKILKFLWIKGESFRNHIFTQIVQKKTYKANLVLTPSNIPVLMKNGQTTVVCTLSFPVATSSICRDSLKPKAPNFELQ